LALSNLSKVEREDQTNFSWCSIINRYMLNFNTSCTFSSREAFPRKAIISASFTKEGFLVTAQPWMEGVLIYQKSEK
jgi:hypothetical protein